MSKIQSRFFPLAFLAAKTTIKALDLTGHAGGTLPGAIAEAIDPAFLGDIAKPDQVIFISGTNGKTTTNNLLNDLLADNGYHTVTNRVGGNISSGFASSFARNATFGGKVKSKLAVMEFDELSGPQLHPIAGTQCALVAMRPGVGNPVIPKLPVNGLFKLFSHHGS